MAHDGEPGGAGGRPGRDVFDDLESEQERLARILAGLEDGQWRQGSGAAGWSVADVMLHLAQTEELVVATVTGDPVTVAGAESAGWVAGGAVDDTAERFVREQRAGPGEVFARWETARRAALAALRGADPARAVPWVAAPLRPRTLATTRLAEHWAHGLDVTEPLGIALVDTDRLWHVAWLAHRTLPYAFALSGLDPPEVRCELTGPGGDAWVFGPAGAPTTVRGPAGDFCRVAARRLPPGRSSLEAEGAGADEVLTLVRTYAA